MIRILGIDPGLRNTGWGIIEKDGSKMRFVAAGVVHSDDTKTLPERLVELHQGMAEIMADWQPDEAAIEETFVNKNPNSTLKLGQARAAVLLAPALAGIRVDEYTPNQVKKMIVGAGHAEKSQVDMMVRTLLKTVPEKIPADAADALAIALCHGFMRSTILK